MPGEMLGQQLRSSAILSRQEAASACSATPQQLWISVCPPADLPMLGVSRPLLTRDRFGRRQLKTDVFEACWRLQRKGASEGFRPKATLLEDNSLVTEGQGKEEDPSSASELSDQANQTNSYIGYGVVVKDESVYRERFVVRFSEVGANGTTSLEMLSSLLQEAACNHVLKMDYRLSPGKNEGKLITVTTRMHIEVDRYPAWRDLLEIDTWFQIEGKNAVRRDWTVKDVKTGDIVAVATSKWVLMNVETKRLSKLTDEVREQIAQHLKDPPRWAMTEDRVKTSSGKIAKLDGAAELQKCGLVPSRSKDFDMNQHVNNVRYISWMLESIPDEVKKDYEVKKITLEYRREAFAGDVIESLAGSEPSIDQPQVEHDSSREPQDLRYIHLLRTVDGEYEINRGRTVWRRAR